MNEPIIDIPWIQPREASIKLMRDAVRYEVRNAFVVAAPLGVGGAVHNFVIFLCSPPPHLSVPPPSFLRCSPSLPLSRASAAFPLPSLPPSLHWLVSRDTFIRARLCGERGQIAQADHRPCQIPREARTTDNTSSVVIGFANCNGILLHPTKLAATVICKAQKTRANETGQTYEELQ